MRGGEWYSVSVTFEALYRAWCTCRRRKRKTSQAQRYELNLLDNLLTAVQTLHERTWSPSRLVCFVVTKPKGREVHAAQFADRVIQHYLMPQLEALFGPVLIHDLYSNRNSKGTHSAVKRLQTFMRRLQNQKSLIVPIERRGPFYLQLDVANFFNCIDRPRLFVMLQQNLKNAIRKKYISPQKATELRWLCHVVLKQDIAAESKLIVARAEYSKVPAHKRLSQAGEGKALPIGNLPSQLFANIYLNALDQFIKHELKCRYYIRYVDDMILLYESYAQLRQWQQQIEHFLAFQLDLTLRPEKRLRPITDGANFLGYIVRPGYLLVRRRVVANLRSKLQAFEQNNIVGSRQKGWTLQLSSFAETKLSSLLASYWGHFSHASSFNLKKRILSRFVWLKLLFSDQSGRLVSNTQPKRVSSFRSQCRYFQRLFPLANTQIQKGWVYQSLVADATQPSTIKQDNLFTCVTRVIVDESGHLPGGLKRRRLKQITIKPGVNLCGA